MSLKKSELNILLREIKEISLNSLSSNIQQKVQTLQGLEGKIREIVLYLKDVREGKLPPNNKIMFLLQVNFDFIQGNRQLIAKLKLRRVN